MPSVFLSYSRADLTLIEQLEAQLKSHPEISIWRDQEKIYGGQKWPKMLGEVIADQDVFVLAWSKNSAASHFVEFEWCTAIALKKTIVPCLLDETSLAPSLRTFHSYRLDDAAGLITSLRGAPLVDRQRREPVIRKLNEITATEETAVLVQAKAVFAQQQWTVQGNVYQAGGDIHIHNEPAAPTGTEKAKPLVEKWQAWVGLIVAILTAMTLVVQLSKNLEPATSPITPTPATVEPLKLLLLSGSIRSEANDPLSDVQVSLPQFKLTTTTDQFGQFRFEVTASDQDTVALLAQKPGYQTYEADVTLGNTALGFTMRKKP
jgi:TIR domain/Carboxypeptidase regulatory-like domain